MSAPRIALPGDPKEGEWKLSPAGLIVPAAYQRRPLAIDLFAGIGGFSLGFHQAGFHVIAAVEFDFDAAITYMVNLATPGVRIHFDTPEREAGFERHLEKYFDRKGKRKNQVVVAPMAGSGWIAAQEDNPPGCEHFWIADVRNLTGKQILDALGLQRGEVTCVTGGPPCQGFSTAGKQNIMDPRNSLVFEFGRLVLEIQPQTFVMENVPGIAQMRTVDGVYVLDALTAMLEKGGYGDAKHLKDGLLATAGLKPGGAMRRRGRVQSDDEDDDAAESVRPRKPKRPAVKGRQIPLELETPHKR